MAKKKSIPFTDYVAITRFLQIRRGKKLRKDREELEDAVEETE